MAFDLKDKRILITGSTDGLGKLLALELAKSGAEIIIHGRKQDKADEVIKLLNEINSKVKHSAIICDLNKPETVAEAFGKIETVDILINNAGLWAEGEIIGLTPERIIEMVNVNLTSYMLTARTLLETLQKSEFAQILNVISVAGYEIPSGYYHTVYSATKFGLQGFSEALAKEYDNKNLRIMGYYPGGMSTDFFQKAGIDYKAQEPWMFDPEESVEAIIFMLTRNPKINVKRMDLINHIQG